MEIVLLPIKEALSDNTEFLSNPLCAENLTMSVLFYARVGYSPPWIGYYASVDGTIVGSGGFKGRPLNGKVEIAYGTFPAFRTKGVGTAICRRLVELATILILRYWSLQGRFAGRVIQHAFCRRTTFSSLVLSSIRRMARFGNGNTGNQCRDDSLNGSSERQAWLKQIFRSSCLVLHHTHKHRENVCHHTIVIWPLHRQLDRTMEFPLRNSEIDF